MATPGGPLLNADGAVIGVNSQIESESGGNVGIGFAVPINLVKDVVSQLLEHGKVEHAYIGVDMATITDELAANVRLPVDHGVLVERVQRSSPAAAAGLLGGTTQVVVDGESFLVGGDVITKADGQPIESALQLRRVVTSKQPGDELALEVHRQDGNPRSKGQAWAPTEHPSRMRGVHGPFPQGPASDGHIASSADRK